MLRFTFILGKIILHYFLIEVNFRNKIVSQKNHDKDPSWIINSAVDLINILPEKKKKSNLSIF